MVGSSRVDPLDRSFLVPCGGSLFLAYYAMSLHIYGSSAWRSKVTILHTYTDLPLRVFGSVGSLSKW
jgi:hypothetical protein